VSGAGGLIGSALTASLERDGIEVRPLVRGRAGKGEIAWDPIAGHVDLDALARVDAVVHLAGEPVGERWTESKKQKIRESRVRGTETLVRAISRLPQPPSVLVSASAVGYYGDRGDEQLVESSPPGNDFLAEVVRAWEAALEPASSAGLRVVRLRFGVVIAREGGALERLLTPFRLGVGGQLGNGRQWMSWISLTDAVRAIRFALTEPDLEGPANAVAPQPVKNAEFTRALGTVLGRPTLFTVPTIALRLAFGEMAEVTLLASQRAVPERLEAAGFRFQHPRIEDALRAALDP
jgi:uncharacterized protein (TIGR01777 family)